MTKKLITKSAALLEDRGFSQVTSAQDRQRKSGGITHTVFEHDDSGERFLVRAKEYCYQNRAPFGKGMVQHAQSDDAMLVIYFDDQERFLAFNPGYVARHGSETTGRSKWESDENRVYLEVETKAGADLTQYVIGHYQPRRAEHWDTTTTRNTGLDDYL